MNASRCVVDTNVLVTANGGNDAATPECAAACAASLRQLSTSGHVFIDTGGRIVEEYRHNLAPFGQPQAGNVFLKWLLTNEWNPTRVTRVPITPRAGSDEEFEELPPPPGVRYDPSDRKFLAVSAAHPEHPPVLQALDSKWWGWKDALRRAGVAVEFLCPVEIARKHADKMGT